MKMAERREIELETNEKVKLFFSAREEALEAVASANAFVAAGKHEMAANAAQLSLAWSAVAELYR